MHNSADLKIFDLHKPYHPIKQLKTSGSLSLDMCSLFHLAIAYFGLVAYFSVVLGLNVTEEYRFMWGTCESQKDTSTWTNTPTEENSKQMKLALSG